MRKALAGLFLTGTWSISSAASAGPPLAAPERGATSTESARPDAERITQANLHYQRGIQRYDEGDDALALVEFQRAYALRPSARVLFNIGQVHYRLHQYAKARAALQQFSRDPDAGVDPELRARVQQQLEALAARTAEIKVQVNVSGAQVVVDDQQVGRSPLAARVLVDVGAHHIGARKSGYRSASRQLSLTGGETIVLPLTLVEVSPPTSPGTSAARWMWWGSAALCTGAVGTGLATLLTSQHYDALREQRFDGPAAAARERLDRQRSLVSGLAHGTDALALAALLSAGVALWLSFQESRPSAVTEPALVDAEPSVVSALRGPATLRVEF